MKVLHGDDLSGVSEINKMIEDGKNVFILVYMDGCGPCMQTKPKWDKMAQDLSVPETEDDIVIADVNKNYIKDLKHIGDIDGYPTMKHIGKKGQHVKAYEDSNVQTKDRSPESFKEWIKNHDKQMGGSPSKLLKRLSKRTKSKSKISKSKSKISKRKRTKQNKSKRSKKK